MLNHIVLMGRLTRDPELRRTQSGLPVASFRLAVDRDFVPKDGGERQADFIDIVAWRNTAEFVSKYFAKGRMAVVSGRLQMREWTDKEGNKRTSAEVVADNVYFGDSRRDSDSQGGGYNQGGYNQQGGYGQGSYNQGGYGGNNRSYQDVPQSGSYGGSTGGYGSSGSYSAPGSDFADLTDDDGDLPF